jgi:putative transposase
MPPIVQLAGDVGVEKACRALEVPASSYYRWLRPAASNPQPRPRPPLALSQREEAAVLTELHSERFIDLAPPEVYSILLEDERHLCSLRTMYRVLERHGEVRERRNQLRHPAPNKPELLATGPNQVWSWDITKLKGPAKWTYFYLYVVLDIYSRYAVGWMLAHQESGELAKRLVRETMEKQGLVDGKELTLHSDRGPSMTSKTLGQLLADLSITRSLSRPYTSNDNPFSEAQFRTLKYRPEFPDRFGSYQDAISFLRRFFLWYNEAHRHGGVGYLTPAQVHYGKVDEVMERRERALAAAFRDHPERFKGRRPVSPKPPTAVWINPPALDRNGDPSSRSRQNVAIEQDQQKTDVLSTPESNVIQESKRVATPAIENFMPIDHHRDHRLAVDAH